MLPETRQTDFVVEDDLQFHFELNFTFLNTLTLIFFLKKKPFLFFGKMMPWSDK